MAALFLPATETLYFHLKLKKPNKTQYTELISDQETPYPDKIRRQWDSFGSVNTNRRWREPDDLELRSGAGQPLMPPLNLIFFNL